MTPPAPIHGSRRPTWRGRLQRWCRRQRRDAVVHAATGSVACALLVGVLGSAGAPPSSPPVADVDAVPAAQGAPRDDEPRFAATFVGDLLFGRHVESAAQRRGYDGLLAEVAPLLTGDYVSGNLEQVVSEREDLPEADKLIHLASGPDALDALVEAGFTTVSLANNHAMDHGIPGLADTIAALDEAGLAHAGAGVDLDAAVEVDLQDHDGLTVATLSFTDVFVEGFIARAFQGGVLQAEPEVFGPLIQRVRAEADLVVVHLHWGREYDLRPSARQRELATLVAEAGADLIVGSHPHVLLPVERIGDTVVLYSLGNFVFDQGWSRTRESVIARYALGADGTARLELVPAYIREGTPRPVTGPLGAYRRARIFQRLRGDTLDWEERDGVLVTELDHRHVVERADAG